MTVFGGSMRGKTAERSSSSTATQDAQVEPTVGQIDRPAPLDLAGRMAAAAETRRANAQRDYVRLVRQAATHGQASLDDDALVRLQQCLEILDIKEHTMHQDQQRIRQDLSYDKIAREATELRNLRRAAAQDLLEFDKSAQPIIVKRNAKLERIESLGVALADLDNQLKWREQHRQVRPELFADQ